MPTPHVLSVRNFHLLKQMVSQPVRIPVGSDGSVTELPSCRAAPKQFFFAMRYSVVEAATKALLSPGRTLPQDFVSGPESRLAVLYHQKHLLSTPLAEMGQLPETGYEDSLDRLVSKRPDV